MWVTIIVNNIGDCELTRVTMIIYKKVDSVNSHRVAEIFNRSSHGVAVIGNNNGDCELTRVIMIIYKRVDSVKSHGWLRS